MLGIIDDLNHITTNNFKDSGDLIFLAGTTRDELGGSEYLKVEHNLVTGNAPHLDLAVEKQLQSFILEAIRNGLVKSAHDISEGGLAVALAESCIADREKLIGATVNVKADLRKDALYFGESQSRVVLSAASERKGSLIQLAASMNVPLAEIGVVGGSTLRINDDIKADIATLADTFFDTIGNVMSLGAQTPARLTSQS